MQTLPLAHSNSQQHEPNVENDHLLEEVEAIVEMALQEASSIQTLELLLLGAEVLQKMGRMRDSYQSLLHIEQTLLDSMLPRFCERVHLCSPFDELHRRVIKHIS